MAELKRAKTATNEEVDVFLKGTDPQERIINIECGYDDRQATVIYRDENGIKHYDLHDFYPFCWAKQEAGRLMFGGDRTKLRMKMQEYGISCKGLIIANEKGEVPERMENGYRVLFFATRPMSNQDFSKFFDEAKVPLRPNEKHKTYGKRLYVTVAPEEQFMIATGKRLFKGYESYDDLVRFSFDLETEGLEARKRDHKISQYGYRTNKGFEKIITVEGEGEEKKINEMKGMREFFKDLADLDPDIVTGYNTENFDWDFMDARAEIDEDSNLGEVSKNEKLPHGVYKKNKPQILKLGGEMERYYPTVMWGKHITDCLFSVRRAQALDSNMKKATLKYVTKYSKIAKKNRVYLNGKIINKTWADTAKTYAFNNENGDWYKTSETKPLKEGYELVTGRYIAERYLLDDIWETDKVELRYNESNFLVGKMLPVKFQRMCTMGTATIWKYIMLAWSYEHDLAIPLETSSRSFTGGLSRLLTVGYIPNVQKLDYNSLYPSIILTFGIKTAIDISGAMPAMLEYVLTNREYYKALKGKYGKEAKSLKKQIEKLVKDMAPDAEIKILQEKQFEADSLSMRNDKMQLPLKITGNAFFGSFGAGGGIFYWSDMDCAEETTCCGRQMLRLMLKWFTDIGYEGIVCDTDGMNFRQPPTFRYTEEHPYVSTGMNRNTEKDKKYVGPWGDLAEFNDLFMRVKNGLDIDEFVPSSCYIARKNYMDLLDVETQKVKLVGNTIKSKKMPIYIEKFIDNSVRDLLNDRGKDYLDKYYDKIDEIYNLRIPLKDIASVGKIKMSIDEYKESCKQRTKAGTKKARQAWYELAIKHNLDVHMGDAVYYINTGTKKGESDVKRVTHYYVEIDNEKVDKTKEFKKEWETLKKQAKDKASQEWQTAQNKLTVAGQNKLMNLDTYVATYHPEAWDEDELIFNCVLVPNDIIEDEEDHYCDDEFEYNVAKYINTFNSRIRPQLVCFDRKIRTRMVQNKKGEWVEENNILITDPKDRKYFTVEEAKEVSGQPYKETDQDTYEQLMTMEDKEIRFWISVNKEPVYWRECGMDWEAIKKEYLDRMEMLKKEGIRQEAELFQKLVSKVTYKNIIDLIEESIIPEQFLEFCDLDPKTGNFISKKWDIKLGSLYDIIDAPVDEDADDEEEPTESTFAGV